MFTTFKVNTYSELRAFYRDYGSTIGGGSVSQDMAKRVAKD